MPYKSIAKKDDFFLKYSCISVFERAVFHVAEAQVNRRLVN